MMTKKRGFGRMNNFVEVDEECVALGSSFTFVVLGFTAVPVLLMLMLLVVVLVIFSVFHSIPFMPLHISISSFFPSLHTSMSKTTSIVFNLT